MAQVLLPKAKLADFVSFLAARQRVAGPVALVNDQYKFSYISSLAEMHLNYVPTILPPKKYFLPQTEPLLTYDVGEGQRMDAQTNVEPVVLFAVHTCDLAGIQCLDMVFSDRPRDLHYQTRKNYFLLIGLECADYCDSYANCAMLRNHLPKGGYDLFFSELEETYLVDISTQAGELIVEEVGLFKSVDEDAEMQLRTLREDKKHRFKSEVPIRYQDLPRLFEETFESPVWQRVGEQCLACGNCTTVCPTCYCFDIRDEPELDLSRGRRVRVWDSCQHEGFAMVAGGENFRPERSERQRHRFNRKFRYPMARYRRMFCTGCGRCSRTCMARIDLKQTINSLLEERG